MNALVLSIYIRIADLSSSLLLPPLVRTVTLIVFCREVKIEKKIYGWPTRVTKV